MSTGEDLFIEAYMLESESDPKPEENEDGQIG